MEEAVTPAGVKRTRLVCLVEGCPFQDNQHQLLMHWQHIHVKKIPLFLCPYDRCGLKTPLQEELWRHVTEAHGCRDIGWFRTLLLLGQMVRNVKFVDPGACPPLAPGSELPPQALPFWQKDFVMRLMVQPPILEAPETEYVVVEEEPPQPPPQVEKMPVVEPTSKMEAEGAPGPLPAGEPLIVLPCVPEMASLDQLTEHLGKLALVSTRAEKERGQTLRLVDTQMLKEVEELRRENQELWSQNNFLESEVQRLREEKRPKLQVVGDLERSTTMMAMALQPCNKLTQVYRLYREHVHLLDLASRDPLMSCEKLWSGGGDGVNY